MRQIILTPKDIHRFWSKVDRRGARECWPWLASVTSQGYGKFSVGGRAGGMLASHRITFFLEHGRWPLPCALHRCDNRRCCNPAHVFEGTQADNVADMCAKGRHHKLEGQRIAIAKLKDANIPQIRELLRQGIARKEIAVRYGVHRSTIRAIATNERWTHVQ